MREHFDIPQAKENRTHSTLQVPFSLYACKIPEMYANVPAHWHEEFELNCIREGEGHFLLNGERLPAAAGDVFLLPPNTLHAAYARDGGALHYEAFVFHPSLVGASGGDRSAQDCILPWRAGTCRSSGASPAAREVTARSSPASSASLPPPAATPPARTFCSRASSSACSTSSPRARRSRRPAGRRALTRASSARRCAAWPRTTPRT